VLRGLEAVGVKVALPDYQQQILSLVTMVKLVREETEEEPEEMANKLLFLHLQL
jgi:hypothetical protein